jgi:hypothetical protein
MIKHIKYLKYITAHRWYVFWECLYAGIPVQGLIHDWHKFLPGEWFPYANHFFGRKVRDKTGYYKPTDTGNSDFDMAWFRHQKRGKHHWQYWAIPKGSGLKLFPMPDKYRKEMVCDWAGASKAQGFDGKEEVKTFYLKNRKKMQLHPETREWVEKKLDISSEDRGKNES